MRRSKEGDQLLQNIFREGILVTGGALKAQQAQDAGLSVSKYVLPADQNSLLVQAATAGEEKIHDNQPVVVFPDKDSLDRFLGRVADSKAKMAASTALRLNLPYRFVLAADCGWCIQLPDGTSILLNKCESLNNAERTVETWDRLRPTRAEVLSHSAVSIFALDPDQQAVERVALLVGELSVGKLNPQLSIPRIEQTMNLSISGGQTTLDLIHNGHVRSAGRHIPHQPHEVSWSLYSLNDKVLYQYEELAEGGRETQTRSIRHHSLGIPTSP